MKTIYLSSKGTKANQVILFIIAILLPITYILFFFPHFEKASTKDIIEALFAGFFWILLIITVSKIADAKLIGDEIIYKKLFTQKKHFKLAKITRLKIQRNSGYIVIKYSEKGKTDTLWVKNNDHMTKTYDIYMLIKDAKKKAEPAQFR